MKLIDADALIGELHTQFFYDGRDRTRVYAKIQDQPTIEPKKGKWIDKSGGIEGAWNYCSVCGEQAIDLYDFCPNCGADMRPEYEEPEINPCRGCADYDGRGGCKSDGGCGADMKGEQP